MTKWMLTLVAGVAIWLVSTCTYTINQTEVGIVERFGRPIEQLAQPGLNFKLPWPVDKVVRVDQRLLVFDNEPAEKLTLDKKNVLVDSFLVWRIENPILFSQKVKSRIEAEARLLDYTSSSLGAAVGSEPMDAFLNVDTAKFRMQQIASRARDEVRTKADEIGIHVEDLQINGFNLPQQNRFSVIDRMVAERARIATAYRSEGEEEALKIEAEANAERERLLAQARSKAEQIRGKGEAEALEVLSKAYGKDPAFYRFLQSLDSYEQILDDNTTIFIESDSRLLDALHGR